MIMIRDFNLIFKVKNNNGVVTLKIKDNFLYQDPSKQATILNKTYFGLYSQTIIALTLVNSADYKTSDMLNITVTVKEVERFLSNLKENKATDP